MKITICGSLKFFEEMKEIEKTLLNKGHKIFLSLTYARPISRKVFPPM